jgi:membrane dipeptidase
MVLAVVVMISRRSLLAGAAFVCGAPFFNRGRFRLFAQSETEYSGVAVDLVRGSTVIDMLSLLTLNWKKLSAWRAQPDRFQPSDFQKLKDSGITVFHPAVGYTAGDIYAASLADITGWNLFIAAHPKDFLRVDCPGDLALAKNLGKIGIVIGQQNSSHFRSVDDVDQFYKMGQRVSQLTYAPNRIGGGSTDPRDPGLTGYGAQIVERMNQTGMAIDVSHCADRTTLDAIAASRKPVLITHSNCRALVPNSARCKTDRAIQKAAEKGGVIGISMIRSFVRAQGPVTIQNVLDHVDHVVKLVGVEHAGVGSDVDLEGREHRTGPTKSFDLDGIDYQKKIFDLAEGLVRRKYQRQDIELILGGNFQRALSQIWAA